MSSCHALVKNDETYTILGNISTLTELCLSECDMESLPEGFSPRPDVLIVSHLPPSEDIGQLKSIQKLDLGRCRGLLALPGGMPRRSHSIFC